MGQTLSHGVYLPAEGERNCYPGLASNWNLLDTAIGDTAGKASATHTHGNISNDGKVGTTANLPLITGTGGAIQAGAFGNQANTFCEGNDSRLSDARTPVAHTHTKSDVTDLFNSANTWTGNNTFSNFITSKESAAISASGFGKGIAFRDYQNNRLGYIQPYLTSNSEKRLVIGADSGDVAANSNLIPNANNSVNLGSSSYQWNNLYANNYYYNGTAWGLDQANVWTGENIFNYDLLIKNANATQGTAPSSNKTWTLTFCDSNKATTGQLYCQYRTNGSIYLPLRINNGTYDYRLNFILDAVGYAGFNPSVSGIINLGSSNYKWKTLNGINPGGLSLPDVATTWEDITGYVLDGTTENRFPISGVTALDGWLQCRVKHTLGTASFLRMEMSYRTWTAQDKDCVEEYTLWVPVKAGASFNKVICLADDLKIRFHPCLGNV